MRLLQEMPDIAVTLIADKWVSDTTSDGAAGLWEVQYSCAKNFQLCVSSCHALPTPFGHH